jgi:hypothetical protein
MRPLVALQCSGMRKGSVQNRTVGVLSAGVSDRRCAEARIARRKRKRPNSHRHHTRLLIKGLSMPALAAAAAEDPAPAHHAAVTTADVRRACVQCAQCIHHIVECDGLPPFVGARRRTGTDSMAQASDAHDARMTRFSFSVRSGSATTSAPKCLGEGTCFQASSLLCAQPCCRLARLRTGSVRRLCGYRTFPRLRRLSDRKPAALSHCRGSRPCDCEFDQRLSLFLGAGLTRPPQRLLCVLAELLGFCHRSLPRTPPSQYLRQARQV